MATYCTAAQVSANLKNVSFGASTTITSDTLDDLIEEESACIDGYISVRYTLPIAETVALAFLRKICIALVVYRVTKILQPKVQAPIPAEGGQDISHVTAYREAMTMLKNIMYGKMALPVEEEKTLNFYKSTAVDDSDDMEFEFETEQW